MNIRSFVLLTLVPLVVYAMEEKMEVVKDSKKEKKLVHVSTLAETILRQYPDIGAKIIPGTDQTVEQSLENRFSSLKPYYENVQICHKLYTELGNNNAHIQHKEVVFALLLKQLIEGNIVRDKKSTLWKAAFSRNQSVIKVQNGYMQIDRLPQEFYSIAEKLSCLRLNNVHLSCIPLNFSALPNLKFLFVNNNEITSIPPDIHLLEALGCFDCSQNRIQALPEEIYLLKNITSLAFENNPLQRLSESVCQLENLKQLNVKNTALFNRVNKRLLNNDNEEAVNLMCRLEEKGVAVKWCAEQDIMLGVGFQSFHPLYKENKKNIIWRLDMHRRDRYLIEYKESGSGDEGEDPYILSESDINELN